jgi:tetratricopeptide (TPR) repeat protein
VHRDIKPENVMLTSGHALVMDFGICRAVGAASEETGLTRAGLTLGTPAYMSPEQWTAPERVSGRSDVYSLGCVLYEMLVGEPPFSGTTTSVLLARHTQQEVPSVRLVRPDLPESVEQVVRAALAKVPEERFSTAHDFGEALNSAFTVPSFTLPSVSSARTSTSLRRRINAKWVWLAAVLLLVAIPVTLYTLNILPPSRGAPTSAPTLSDNRVVVGLLENRTGDPALNDLGRMAADWITEGLHRTGVEVVPSPTALQAAEFVQEQVKARRVRDPIRALADEVGAARVITGAYDRDGDAIVFSAQITNARTGDLISPIEEVRGSPAAPGEAIKQVRNRVMGALALSSDERMATTTGAASQPPRFESYRAFSRGLDRYIRNDNRAALNDFYEAVQLDSSFTVALLYAAFCLSNLGEHARVDSLTRKLALKRDELTEHNRYWLEYMEARVQGNNTRALSAIRRAAAIAPVSKASYNRAYVAKMINQPRETVDALSVLDPERGAMRGWFQYWEVLTDAQHRLGEHKAELEAAQQARTLYPERPEPRLFELEALAALGRMRDIDRLLSEIETVTPKGLTPGEAISASAVELRAHGHADDARAMFDRALRWYRTRPATGAATPAHRAALAGVLQEAGHWQEARQTLQELTRAQPDLAQRYRAWLGILAAGTGDRAEALSTDAWLARLQRPYTFGFDAFQRARIAALLNDKVHAVELVRQAFAQGYQVPRHIDINFDALRDYPQFNELFTVRN